MELKTLIEQAHQNAVNKGFWDKPTEFGTKCMLVVTELSEAVEAHREGDWEHTQEEIADTFIRLFDLCGGTPELAGIDEAIAAKMARNATRPRLHGKQY